MPWIQLDRLPKETERPLPLLQHDALVPAERVRVDTLDVELGGAFEAFERSGVVLEVTEDVAGGNPRRRGARGDDHEVLSEEREGGGEPEVPEERRVELHRVEEVWGDDAGLSEGLFGLLVET